MPDQRDDIAHCVGNPENQNDIARLIKQLGSSNTLKSEEAGRILGSMGAAAVEPLLAAVAKEARLRRFWKVVCLLLIGLVIEGKVWKFFHRGLEFTDFNGFAYILLFFLQPPGATARHHNLVRLLAGIDDLRAVGPFAEALAFTHLKDGDARKVAVASLIRLLPRLRASDGYLLNRKQRGQLHRALLRYDKPLTMAILKAFEQIGDVHDLPALEKVCSPDREIMEAAKICVLSLLTRAEQKKVSQTLLRPSGLDSTTNVALLRSATGQDIVEPHILLRAVSDGVEDVQ